jgi:hypothetical protein
VPSAVMGAVFGITGGNELHYSTLHSAAYEVRQHDSYLVAEIDEVDDNKAFTALAKYIGAVGPIPQNKQCE